MRELAAVVGVIVIGLGGAACTSGGTARDGGASEAPVDLAGEQPALSGAGGAGTGGGSDGGAPGAGGAAAAPSRDCLPACVANLRRDCQRPAVDAGTCVSESSRLCYSNGVHEVTTAVDGGMLVVLTKADGRTPCYQVFLESGGLQHYQTPAGQDVGTGMANGNGGYTFTCDGATVTVDFRDPTCATLNVASCTVGACP